VPVSGLQVLRDGVPVEREEMGLAVPVDPGEHAVVVTSPGHAALTLRAHVGPESPTASVVVDALGEDTGVAAAPPPAAAPPAPLPQAMPADGPPAAAPASGADSGTTRRWVGIGIGGLGVVGIGVGSALGLVAKSKLDQSNDDNHCIADHCDAKGLGLRKDAESAATGSTLFFVAGGVALATGIVLFVTAPRAQPATGIVVVAPVPLAGGGGALVRATF
jgi:hypothetical protein